MFVSLYVSLGLRRCEVRGFGFDSRIDASKSRDVRILGDFERRLR
jgi:hypothetical protein